MTNYFKLSQNPSRFLSLTCSTIEEFEALLPPFASKFFEHMKNLTFCGHKRHKRQYVEYKNASLPTIENKLLFILIYLKGNISQEMLAEMFAIQQSKANVWIHLLHRILNETLESLDVLPARDAKSLELIFEKLKSEAETTSEETKLETETLSSGVDIKTKTTSEEAELETEILSSGVDIKTKTTSEEAELKTETLSEKVDVEAETLSSGVESDLIEIELYLHDGTERPINRPLNQEIQKLYYSGKASYREK